MDEDLEDVLFSKAAQARALERLLLCTYTIQETHYEIEKPTNPEDKADLLITVEALVFEAIDLLETTKKFVWGTNTTDDDYPEE